MAGRANSVFRDNVADGIPSSGLWEPRKSEIRSLLTYFENSIDAGLSNGGLIYSSLANLNADLDHGVNSSAWVVADTTIANNGIYRKSGASGTGSWSRIADLPYSVIPTTNQGVGTADNVTVATSSEISETAFAQLISVPFVATNTGAMTLLIQGSGVRRDLLTNIGQAIPAGYVPAGSIMLVMLDNAGNYRLFSYGDSNAVSVIYARSVGGTADAVTATTSFPVSLTAYSQLIAIPFEAENTGAMTLSVNGTIARPIVTNVGGAIPASYIQAGMAALVMVDEGGNFRLFSYGDASAIQAAAEGALAEFQRQYLGRYSSHPSTDPGGGALQEGAFYWNTASKAHFYWDGDSWEAFPFATVVDGGVTIQKLDPNVSSDMRRALGVPTTDMRRVIDFHWGCALGIGFIDGVDDLLQTFTIAADITAGATSFTYTGTGPGISQLLVFLGTDGLYYTAQAGSSAAGTCTMRSRIPVEVVAGDNCWSFWSDNAHPNEMGYKAIIDYALRQDFSAWRKVFQRDPVAVLGATVTASTSNNVNNPGSVNSGFGWQVAVSGGSSGMAWYWKPKRSGIYKAVFMCSRYNSTTNIVMSVDQNGIEIGNHVVDLPNLGRREVVFGATGGLEVVIEVRGGNDTWLCSTMVILEMVGESIGVNWGKHMVFGDSWTANALGLADRLGERLDRATVVKSGVGGNEAGALLARFDADVATVPDLDFVWVMVGTNDIAHDVSVSDFTTNLLAVVGKIVGIGAIPIIFTPYPGCTDEPDRIDVAKTYVATVPYYDQDSPLRGVTRYNICANVAASATVPLLSIDRRQRSFKIMQSYISHGVQTWWGASQPAIGGQLNAIASGWNTTPVIVTPPDNRFIQITRTAGGSAEVVTGFIDIEDD